MCPGGIANRSHDREATNSSTAAVQHWLLPWGWLTRRPHNLLCRRMEKQRPKLKYRMASKFIAPRYRHDEPDAHWEALRAAVHSAGSCQAPPALNSLKRVSAAMGSASLPVTPLLLAIMKASRFGLASRQPEESYECADRRRPQPPGDGINGNGAAEVEPANWHACKAADHPGVYVVVADLAKYPVMSVSRCGGTEPARHTQN
jgi:hypothetical protein